MEMKIIHRLGDRAIKKEGEGYFLLTDKAGSYISLGSPWNISHMQGLFHLDKNWNMFKSLENIYPDKEMTEVENGFCYAIRRYNDSEESFHLTATALIYEMKNYDGYLNIDVDFREMFNYDDKNRIYSIKEKDGYVIIHYKKNNKYLVIRGAEEIVKKETWDKRDYPFDKDRGEKYQFYIYKALRIKCKNNIKLFISFANSEKEAIDNARSASINESTLKETLNLKAKHIFRKKNFTINSGFYSLESLRTVIGKGGNKMEGVFAGLPWFYQFWSRDGLISMKAIMLEERFDFVKTRLSNYLDMINDEGRLPNRLPESKLSSSDSIGWLFKRIDDFLKILEKNKCMNVYFSKKELEEIKHKLHFCIEEHMVRYMHDEIIYSEYNETWMDTAVDGNDGRTGACIEMQALFLVFFKLMRTLCKYLKHTYKGYESLEKMIAKKVRKEFFVDNMLKDMTTDGTIRPNIFITYYLYPDLLSENEWKIVFNKALRALWLDWGGLSTIDKNHPLFQPYYTGENNISYHRGDSWYWINNLAAICMHDLDKKKFKYQIDLIYAASEHEMLYSGFIGHCSEISSANQQESKGCLSQAWSVATLIELAEKLGKK